ncbi:methyl-accepting chemotaxis protein [Paenibacillus sophorae]|uniref:Methyl-accepting chemotaxis protein n=1 Tax=Paenibacillus sophorae TaxID=1333845 RepID=A0A1H8L2A4_9BACL|nr:methyl-accepting chemotaxis protein [Paenibacillus sophorae]QWU17470.1 methyl-accepting chemotaxis protein [Paenibacillus sophorae]SEN98956.1 methyl-accepting chemotaxis protein [Paenibacillus sophorae]
MFRIRHSIGRRFMLLLLAALLFTSLTLSISFYFISINTLNSYVVPQIDKLLSSASQDVFKQLNSTNAMQARTNEQAATNVEYYFRDKRTQHNVETIFLVEYKDGKAAVLSADHESALKRKEEIQVTPALEQASKGKSGISEIYSDSHGVHKTAYVGIPGSTLVIGVSADMTFIKDKVTSTLWTSAGITLLALIISMTAALFMSRRITRPITKLAAYSDQLAEGDFTQELDIKGHDEISRLGESFQAMTLRLKDLIGEVLSTSDTVMADSNELKERVDGIRDMAESSRKSAFEIGKGSTAIASSAADNARAMEEISLGIQHIASAAGEVTEQIHEASAEAVSGNNTAQSAVEQMRQVGRASKESLEQFRKMDEQSQKIGDIVQGISEITKQIQMLSLNASIEAARAGEHGRGFAVVAGEVRKLSEQSREATEQIREFLLRLQEEMQRSVASMNEVNTEVASGVGKVEEAGNAFDHLTILIQSINQSVQSVSAATQQISAGTEEVTASVEETAQITSKSQAGAEILADNYRSQQEQLDGHAKTVEHLYGQTLKMQEAVRKFKI